MNMWHDLLPPPEDWNKRRGPSGRALEHCLHEHAGNRQQRPTRVEARLRTGGISLNAAKAAASAFRGTRRSLRRPAPVSHGTNSTTHTPTAPAPTCTASTGPMSVTVGGAICGSAWSASWPCHRRRRGCRRGGRRSARCRRRPTRRPDRSSRRALGDGADPLAQHQPAVDVETQQRLERQRGAQPRRPPCESCRCAAGCRADARR